MTTDLGTRLLRVWLDGRLYVDPDDARVGATDHGLIVGDGVFEAIKVTPAGPFAVSRHLLRLSRSAAAMGLPAPDHAQIRGAIAEVLDGWPGALGKVRVTYTGGLGPLGSQAPYGPPTLVVAVEPSTPAAAEATIVTVPWSRNENGALTGVKSTSYAENVRSLAYAHARGGTEAIFANTAGNLCEGTGSNIFAVLDGVAVTPPLSAGPLAGITREVLCGWLPVVERNLTMAMAKGAAEVFLTSTLRDVQAVRRWDDRDFSSRHPVTDQFAQVFAERSGLDLDP